MSQAFAVLRGGGRAGLGQATGTVTQSDVINELESRGYREQVVHHAAPAIHHAAPRLTKSMAISVAIDEGLELDACRDAGVAYLPAHPHRCPNSGGCPVPAGLWANLIRWCVTVANGYLSGGYALPGWAQDAMDRGVASAFSGLGLARGGLRGLSGVGDWLKENTWFIQSVGDALSNYGEFLTAQDVKSAIEASAPKGALTREDVPALVAMLQEGGFIPEGKTQEVAQGAEQAAVTAMPAWVLPVVIGGGVLLILTMMRK